MRDAYRTRNSALAAQLWTEGVDLADQGRIEEAMRKYEQSAALGNPYSQSNLATLLLDRVHPPRTVEAVALYKKAVRSGLAAAAFNLSMHYKDRGAVRWQKHWLGVAARLGDPEAQRLCARGWPHQQ